MTDPPSDRDGPGGPTKPPKLAAQRARDLYWRRKKKKRSLRVNLTEEYLDQIVRDGWIATEQVTDPEILGCVVEDRDDSRKLGNFEAGPIVTGTRT